MKVAILGVNGQLGSDIVLTAPGSVQLEPIARERADITDASSLAGVLESVRPGAVINTAAYVRVDDAEDNAELAFRVNAIAARDIARICERLNAVLLHVSTDYVFDGLGRSVPYTEDDIPNPVNTYGLSKFAGEIYVRNISTRHYIARVSSLYGKRGSSGKGGNFVYTILEKAKKGELLRVVDDIFMSPTYTLDAAGQIWKLLLDKKAYGVYHLNNSGHVSWHGFAQKIVEKSGLACTVAPVKHTEYKTKAKRPLWSALASTKIEARGWEEALEDFLS